MNKESVRELLEFCKHTTPGKWVFSVLNDCYIETHILNEKTGETERYTLFTRTDWDKMDPKPTAQRLYWTHFGVFDFGFIEKAHGMLPALCESWLSQRAALESAHKLIADILYPCECGMETEAGEWIQKHKALLEETKE